MHFRSAPGLALRMQGSYDRCDHPADLNPETDVTAPGAQLRPFVERRRPNPVEDYWPESLDKIQRHLVGLELANKALQESETKFRDLFEGAPLGMFQTNPAGKLLEINYAMARILGFESVDEVLEQAAREELPAFFNPDEWDQQRLPGKESDVRSGIELKVSCRNGEMKWVRFNIRKVWNQGRLVRFDGTAEDVTDRKQAEIKTEFLAYYDLLTGLPNQTLLHERLVDTLAAARERGRRIALLLVELDRFKVINDSLGEEFGDRLLQELAARLRSETVKDCVVARVGGAEFAIILPDVDDVCQVRAVAKYLMVKLNAEYCFLGQSFNAFCYVGISIFPENGADSEALMKRSDVAMCRAREDSPNRFAVFTEEMNDRLVERLTLENGLRQVLARNELFLEYQPQVDIRTGAITGLEALLRWKHSKLGLIPPDNFIEIAETSGLIVPIGEWVLRKACSQARAWQEKGLPAVPVSVNVSAIQFRQQGFSELVGNVLRETGLSPELLELELTESLLLSNADVMSSTTAGLRELGVTLAIDDFGTGYSSLGYLKQFKVNRLKIDRSFIKDVPVDADGAAIAIAIIEMARALNLAVLAEGVEKEAQLAFLRKQQCYTIQGFYFSKPASADKIGELLQTGFGHLISVGAA